MDEQQNIIIYRTSDGRASVALYAKDGKIWLNQQQMAELFATSKQAISYHIINILKEKELKENSVVKEYLTTAADGKNYNVVFYSLEMIIAVGYRVRGLRGIQFRQWATKVLRDFALRGYVLDRKRMENGRFLGEDYFEHLLAEIREIRMSERRFYQKITDIYATSMDYDPKSQTTREFFAKVQNKLHYAVHGHTAAELIMERADAEKEHMGLTTWENAPNGKILKPDVSVAKNYLNETEMQDLSRIVNAYLDLAENRARRHVPMTMEDWARHLDRILMADDRELLQDAGKISAEVAKAFAEGEFEKFRVKQDRLYQSEFDHFLAEAVQQENAVSENNHDS